jgi:cytochrome c
LKTVGSYWPYLSTTWDYVNRSMPFGAAQTLDADEVYALVAYILYSNDLVDEDFVLSNETFLDVEMPNADGFIVDDRIETEFSRWVGEPCMSACKETVEITMRAMVLDVTPQEDAATKTPEPEASVAIADLDPELVAAGEKVFKKCKACHQVGEGAKNRTGPHLNGIMGRAAGAVEGFKYSDPLVAKASEGLVWTEDEMAAFLAAPRTYLKGTKMSFAGLKKDNEIRAINAYLTSLGQ